MFEQDIRSREDECRFAVNRNFLARFAVFIKCVSVDRYRDDSIVSIVFNQHIFSA